MAKLDETAFNVLLLDDQVEPATAYVASECGEAERTPEWAKSVGYLAAIVAMLAAAYWLS